MPKQTPLARIAVPTRISGAIDFMPDYTWQLWLATPDFIHGTYLKMYLDGRIERVTVRQDEGDEIFTIRETDDGETKRASY